MKKKNQKSSKPKIDPMFDGHPEKSFSEMTPKERLHYVWLQMLFKYRIRNRKIIKNKI